MSKHKYEVLTDLKRMIRTVKKWNEGIVDADDYLTSDRGHILLTGSALIIDAIGDLIRQYDFRERRDVKLPALPWDNIKDLRRTVELGKFDVDADQVFLTIKEGLTSLEGCVDFLLENQE